MNHFTFPIRLLDFHQTLASKSCSYSATGQTKGDLPAGFDGDDNRVLLGSGEPVYRRAKIALQSWKMFPESWTKIYYPFPQFEVGKEVALAIRLLGVWWYCGARIVYVVDEPKRYGFAYGTLSSHLETGEELFIIEQESDGKVYFRIRAFSRPNRWYVILAYPFARAMQRRFVKHAFRQLKKYAE